jgi:hypothetical protein
MKKQLLLSFAAAALLTACGTTESKMGMGASLQDLPQAAQASVQQQIGSAQILDIDKERRTGREVYEVTYQDSSGQKQKLHVAADGTILSQRQAGARGLMHEAAGAFRGDSSSTDTQQNYQQRGEYQNNESGASAQFNADSSSTSTQGAGVSAHADLNGSSPSASATYQKDSANVSSSQSADFSAGAQNSRSSDLNSSSNPSASANYSSDSSKSNSSDFSAGAQSSQSGASVETSTTSGQSAEFNANADSADRIEAKKEVRGGAEGLLQKPSLDIQESSGAERTDANAELKSDSSSSSSSVDVSKDSAGAEKRTEATVDTDTEHAGKTHMTFESLPAAVQTAVREHGDTAQIEKISKKTKDGKTVYDIHFKGDSDKLCISEDGTVMEKDK